MECQYCYRKLSSKSSLSVHQTKTKYCLKLQEKQERRIYVRKRGIT